MAVRPHRRSAPGGVARRASVAAARNGDFSLWNSGDTFRPNIPAFGRRANTLLSARRWATAASTSNPRGDYRRHQLDDAATARRPGRKHRAPRRSGIIGARSSPSRAAPGKPAHRVGPRCASRTGAFGVRAMAAGPARCPPAAVLSRRPGQSAATTGRSATRAALNLEYELGSAAG